MFLESFLKRILPNMLLLWGIHMQELIATKSLYAAIREQKLLPVYHQITEIVPDITHQYTSFDVNSEYLKTKVRAEHSFQIALVNEALQFADNLVRDTNPLTIVDIGDSAGTHLQYIKGLHQNRNIRSLSVNIDSEAVRRIKEKGLEAICARAEDLASLSIEADVFLSFEMLEHLMDPSKFLHNISQVKCKALVISVPYLARSRVGLHHIRSNQKRQVNPENTHIFELSPQDWRLIFKHSGWAIVTDKIYLQYPKRSPFRFWLKRYWRRYDFEGFYGAILKPDKSWSELYDGW
jgi:hypothetical protein